MLSGERKKFELRTARAPKLVAGLSNTVIVYENDVPKYCHISFSDDLIIAVGEHLPRGVSMDDKAFMQAVLDGAEWTIYACYVETWERVALWRAGAKPAWLKELKTIRYTNDNPHQNTQGTTKRTASRDATEHATTA